MSLFVNITLVEALCTEHQSNLIKLDNKKNQVGLCKSGPEEKPHKVFVCSCVVVKDYDKESLVKDDTEEYLKCEKQMNENMAHENKNAVRLTRHWTGEE